MPFSRLWAAYFGPRDSLKRIRENLPEFLRRKRGDGKNRR
jgi:hypothetical protein